MGAWLDLVGDATRVPLWLDYDAYAGQLIGGGCAPYLDAPALIAWHRSAQALLKPEIVPVDAANILRAWLASNSADRASLREGRRALAPLKRLLALEPLRLHIREVLTGLRATFPRTPLALVTPAPGPFAQFSYGQAFGEAGLDIDQDGVENAAMLIADFLRGFGDLGVDALLLREADHVSAPAATRQPIANIAGVYGWDLGVRGGEISPEGLGFCIAPAPIDGLTTGVETGPEFWRAAEAPTSSTPAFLFSEIPAAENPETVLRRIEICR